MTESPESRDDSTGTRRGRRPIRPDPESGPVALFAHRLWELKERAGDPSFADMASRLGAAASKSSLAAAARGSALPSWETTWEFVRVLAVDRLGGNPEEVRREWRTHWERAANLGYSDAGPTGPAEGTAPDRPVHREGAAPGAPAGSGTPPPSAGSPAESGPLSPSTGTPAQSGPLPPSTGTPAESGLPASTGEPSREHAPSAEHRPSSTGQDSSSTERPSPSADHRRTSTDGRPQSTDGELPPAGPPPGSGPSTDPGTGPRSGSGPSTGDQPAAAPASPGRPASGKRLTVLAAVTGVVGVAAILIGWVLPLITGDAKTGPTTPPSTSPSLVPFDDSKFEKDVTYPDGTVVESGESFDKTWRIRNTGNVPWHGRYLTRMNDTPCKAPKRVGIGPVAPGDSVDITVRVRAAGSPGRCKIYWKMTDEDGSPLLAGKRPIFLDVTVA
ncbi:Ig-like domain-containing protein [Nonomuraea fuscirosea]|uniref:Ig-like domain-containing protein n=1 Tax=Nonomuraea fuscirosea TaxID=1291556 RepID=A0A2T0MTK9_9ACTN|nr:NBR1-Ig-like domain-containing protein [Nonomuraea fuscirosea]PRX61928.1 Ig-like domain-containing protein [Nonomuraea fuscirosea]